MMGTRTTTTVFFFLAVVASVAHATNRQYPVVLWHGMGDYCCSPESMDPIRQFIQDALGNDTTVLSLRIGATDDEDVLNGFFMNINKQIDYVWQQLSQDPRLADGFYAVGFSQGGQMWRGYAQRYNHHGPARVRRLVSVGGQHQGVFGLPRCMGARYELCALARRFVDLGIYISLVQDRLVQAEYWQDPFNLAEYRKASVFLADINQEQGIVNDTYRSNMQSLEALVLVKFLNDTMVQPRESEWFGFYREGQAVETYNVWESPLYTNPADVLGLRALNESGRLHFLATEGNHLQFTLPWFGREIVDPFLRTL